MSEYHDQEGSKPLENNGNSHKYFEEAIRIKDFAIASSINGIAIGDLNGICCFRFLLFCHGEILSL